MKRLSSRVEKIRYSLPKIKIAGPLGADKVIAFC